MDQSHIELNGSHLSSIIRTATGICIAFSRALITKRMTGSRERTRWWQAGALILEGLEAETEWPAGAQFCVGGRIDENVYSYQDMIPIPFASCGGIRCQLALAGQGPLLVFEAAAARLELEGVAKYIEHLRT